MPEAHEPRLMKAPDDTRDVVADLVERYRRDADQYARGSYKEAQLRVEFIDPFFEALGWDIANVRDYSQRYRDVIYEDTIKVGGATKAPDYCFKIGIDRKFFLEAKKPSVHIKTDPSPAYQLRRYGWSAKLPLSILTDFEEFAVYDCSKRPQETDGPSVARVDFITYDEYVDRLDDIYSIFAKEAILKGSFDRYAEGTRRKRGTSEVDSEFLQEIEQWREMLAKDIARHNLDLSVHDLNFAVQTTIDRILFFRIAEDRGVEPYGRLRDLLDGTGLYPRLCQLYQQADTKYNAGLFDFSASGDRLTPDLEVSDKALQSILAELYYPQCPYEFSVIGADILGAVYEQFLGKVIRLTPSHRAKVEEKPEVKKAGGVYYTPTYIVDYIVEHTVGPALEESETPKAASKLRILDPACGSGSFLLGAYQYLLNWHLDYYTNHSPKKHARGPQPAIIQVRDNEWRLSTFERKRILLNNIYGVDIDSQAVEVTKLNLLLKCMEGETEETLSGQLQLAQERVLPNIDDNIKCGNSLIGPDYYEGRQLALLDDEAARRVNAFDWETEFADIMAAGSFDCVIGNPPYVSFYSRESMKPDREVEAYLESRFADSLGGRRNTFLMFLSHATELVSDSGYVSMIVPDTLANNESYEITRRKLVQAGLRKVVRLDFAVFDGATVGTVIPILGPGTNKVELLAFSTASDVTLPRAQSKAVLPVCELLEQPYCRWTFGDLSVHALLANISAGTVPMESIAETRDGVNPGPKSFRSRMLNPKGARKPTWRPVIEGRHITSFYIHPTNEIVDYDPALLTQELKKQGASFRQPRIFSAPKLVNRQTADTLIFALDDVGYCTLNSAHNTRPKDGKRTTLLYLLGILNSNTLRFYYRRHSEETRKVFPQVHISALRQLPIRPIGFDDPADVARHDKMVELVETMLELHKRLAQVKTPRSRERLQRQIAATDQAIDKLVYELYDLTEEEIAIVEGQA